MKDTGKSTEQQQASSSAKKDTSFLYGFRRREKQQDIEKGKDAEKGPSQYERRRAEVKQRFKDTLTSHEDGETRLDRPSAEAERVETEATDVVKWLKKEVLAVTSDERAAKIEKKVLFALEQRPATAKLLREGMQVQSQWDKGYVTHRWWYGSQLSRIKHDITIELKEERTRLARLSGETSKPTKEMERLEKRVEKSNILKEGIARIREKALEEAKIYMESDRTKGPEEIEPLEPQVQDLKRRIHLDRIRTAASQEINALKQEHRDNLLKDEITGEQKHTTWGVNLGNVFHSAETVLALGSVFVSGWALQEAIKATNAALAVNASNSTGLHQ